MPFKRRKKKLVLGVPVKTQGKRIDVYEKKDFHLNNRCPNIDF